MSGGAVERLARTLLELPKGASALVMGRILSTAPLRILAEGNAQDRDSLLRSTLVDLEELSSGDQVLLCPIEQRQRYVILAKVVEL